LHIEELKIVLLIDLVELSDPFSAYELLLIEEGSIE